MVALGRKITIALLVVVWLVAGAPGHADAASSPPQEAPAPDPMTSAPLAPARRAAVPGTAAEIERFAARERLAGHLERFEGGSRISTTTIVIILLVVIILILLLH
jgi:hypothetical protein